MFPFFFRNLLFEHKFHFVALQETMQQVIEDSLLRQIDPMQTYLWKWIPSIGKSEGILSGINLEFFDVGSFCEGQFILQLNLWDKVLKKKWNLLNVYEAAHDENRREFLSELARYCNQNHDPFMVGGDFNLVRFSSKKTKATSTDIPLFSMLSLTVKNCLISKWWGVNIPGQIIRPPYT